MASGEKEARSVEGEWVSARQTACYIKQTIALFVGNYID